MKLPNLSRLLELESPVRQPDNAGGYVESWATLGCVWAEVTIRSGRERAEVDMPVSTVRWRVVVRASPVGASSRPKAGQRFREGVRVMAIRAVAERDPFGRYLTCFAEEEVAI
ncbi:head-tail adaptor protein [Pontibaca salina]|uniref:Head-tail adaptor protein n=1 Tax=Pontibaca salina TaxID=2795731 RepID=A0A934HVS7_9RHOB|nr:head-tail adaptor protein [Pontibaca salina]MBI6630429.1 head-tail adaptor protein [Pontibaca salina]